jgi:hypothetical protein
MSELLAAIPNLFKLRRRNDYARVVHQARAERLVSRAMNATHRQMVDAYEAVIPDAEKTKHSREKTR